MTGEGRGACTGLHVAYKLKLHIVSVQTFCVLLKENVLGNVFAKHSAKLVRQRERERHFKEFTVFIQIELYRIHNSAILVSVFIYAASVKCLMSATEWNK